MSTLVQMTREQQVRFAKYLGVTVVPMNMDLILDAMATVFMDAQAWRISRQGHSDTVAASVSRRLAHEAVDVNPLIADAMARAGMGSEELTLAHDRSEGPLVEDARRQAAQARANRARAPRPRRQPLRLSQNEEALDDDACVRHAQALAAEAKGAAR